MTDQRPQGTDAEWNARQEIVRIGRLLWERGYLAAGDGNVSVRLGPDRLLTTPSGLSKGFLQPEQLVLTDLEGARLPRQTAAAEGLQPSSELRVHCEAYRQRPDIAAVVHAHPVAALACSLAGVSLAEPLLPEALIDLGSIPTARYATPASAEGPEVVRELIRSHDALILDRHGSLTVGATVWEAYLRLERLEHAAAIVLAARQFGAVPPLPPEEVERLRAMHRRKTGRGPGGQV